MEVNSPTYVAGFERGVRPIGLWSISMTLSIWPMPSTLSCRPTGSRDPNSSRASAR
jgi:hypothetical protein